MKAKSRFSQVAESWLHEKQAAETITLATAKQYQALLEGPIWEAFGDSAVQEITETMLRGYVMRRRVNRAALNMEWMLISAVLEYAVEKGMLPHNPCVGVSIPRRKSAEIRILYDRDILNLEAAMRGHRYEGLILIILYMGLQVGEALGLRWEDVDLVEGRIWVRRHMVTWYDRSSRRTRQSIVPCRRRGQERMIKLPILAQGLLEKIPEAERHGPVFREPDGEEIQYASLYDEFHGIMAQIGRPDVTLRGLRYTAEATMLYESGDRKALRDYLGTQTPLLRRPTYPKRELENLVGAVNRRAISP